MLQLNN